MSAPVHSDSDVPRAGSDLSAWGRFASPRDHAEFFDAWLSLLAARIPRSQAAVLLARDRAEGAFTVAAV